MKNNIDLTKIFGRFAGMEVPLKEEKVEIDFQDGNPVPYTIFTQVNDPDPVLEEMQQEAEKHGLHIRATWPTQELVTMDMRWDRVNVRIEKEDDGKWRVQPTFRIG